MISSSGVSSSHHVSKCWLMDCYFSSSSLNSSSSLSLPGLCKPTLPNVREKNAAAKQF